MTVIIIMFLIPNNVLSQKLYAVDYHLLPKDSLAEGLPKKMLHSFQSRDEAQNYITNLPSLLSLDGFIGSSIDSVNYDSAKASVILFLGARYKWSNLQLDSIEPAALENIFPKKLPVNEDIVFGKGL
ncbi:MAG: hypothetical protein ABI266_05750, partial [Ginsengibacter sp.]